MIDSTSTLETALCKMSSFEAIKDCLNGYELHPFQCVDVMKMIAVKRAMVVYATGKGKTLLAAAAMKLLWNEDPTRKFIMFVRKDQLIQTPKKIMDACGREVLATAANAESLDGVLSSDFTKYSVLMLTHDCLRNGRLLSELFKVKDQYCGIIIDEAHKLDNLYVAQSASMLARMVSCFEFCWALTATPIESDINQLTKLASIVDSKRFPDYRALKRALLRDKRGIEAAPGFFIKRDSSDFGGKIEYRGMIEWVDPMPHQLAEIGGFALMDVCKGHGATNQAQTLVRLIRERRGSRGLIYINQHKIREWVLPFLQKAGIRYACINGKTKPAERAQIMKRFNEVHDIDVVITSVTTAVDLDCDFVIFYEFTLEVKQMIGRAHRGLGDKMLEVIFVITDDTREVDYFLNNILKRSLMIRDILKMDFSEMEQAGDAVGEHYGLS